MSLNVLTRLLKRKELSKLLPYKQQIVETNVFHTHIIPKVQYSILHNQILKGTKLRELQILRFYSVKTEQKKEDDDYRSDNSITVIGQDIPSPFVDIEASGFPEYIKTFLKMQGITKPTVIQSQGWPIALSGKNFVGIAQTGTGKTLAFLLPAVVHIKENKAKKGRGPIVLVLAPTRELARQIEQVAQDFNEQLGIRCACIYGGANRSKQAAQLQAGVDIVIATPGRLNDFLITKTTTLSRCTYVVLDEADRMLDMGFEPQIRQALEGVPLERQILMFSATWPKEVRTLAKDYLGEFVQVNVGSTELSANRNIQQIVHVCEQDEKAEKFTEIMHKISGLGFGKTLVFTNTKKSVDYLERVLRGNGWPALGIHGDRTQLQRDMIINKFKTGKTNILVATDVAARGLDVDGVTHVVNYDYPNTSEDYIHRIGRTGRQDNKGISHSILTEENARQAKDLIEVLKEAKQDIPKELYDLARSFDITKSTEKFYKKKSFQKPYNFSNNASKRWNRFRNDRYY